MFTSPVRVLGTSLVPVLCTSIVSRLGTKPMSSGLVFELDVNDLYVGDEVDEGRNLSGKFSQQQAVNPAAPQPRWRGTHHMVCLVEVDTVVPEPVGQPEDGSITVPRVACKLQQLKYTLYSIRLTTEDVKRNDSDYGADLQVWQVAREALWQRVEGSVHKVEVLQRSQQAQKVRVLGQVPCHGRAIAKVQV